MLSMYHVRILTGGRAAFVVQTTVRCIENYGANYVKFD